MTATKPRRAAQGGTRARAGRPNRLGVNTQVRVQAALLPIVRKLVKLHAGGMTPQQAVHYVAVAGYAD